MTTETLEGFDFTADTQADLAIDASSLDMFNALDDIADDAPAPVVTDENDFTDVSFDSLDDEVWDEATDPNKPKENETTDGLDDEGLEEVINPDEFASLDEYTSAVAEHWEQVADDVVIGDGLTKGELLSAHRSSQANDANTAQFNTWQTSIGQQLESLGGHVAAATSEVDMTIRDLEAQKRTATDATHRGQLDMALSTAYTRKQVLTQETIKMQEQVIGVKKSMQQQQLNNFKRDMQKAEGSSWATGLLEIKDHYTASGHLDLLRDIDQNPTIEKVQILRDAMAYRKGKAATQKTLKKMAKPSGKSSSSTTSSRKGNTPPTKGSKKALEAKFDAGVMDSDVFAALED
jgi:hypothetical protein